MNGIEAAPKLKKLLPETPIILFTFHEGMMRGFDGREAGVDAVVTKANGMFPLKESVKVLLQRHHLSVRQKDDNAKAKR
jgi:DNA-binding response OmpR family regulator